MVVDRVPAICDNGGTPFKEKPMPYAIVLNKSDLTRETPKAWAFWDAGDVACGSVGAACSETVWFPKSLCTLTDLGPDLYQLVIPDWLARKTGLNNTKYDGIDKV